VEIIKPEEYAVSEWAGGKTTQLYIYPQGSEYAKRNFLLRISSATVECERSEFTSLPQVERIILPLSGGSHINLMRAESPGPSVGKLVPKVKHTARILYIIYLGMTVIEILLLLLGDMPLFDALTTAFGTAGTGGFGIKNTSMMDYSPYLQWVVTIFMILFGVNFNAYYLMLFGKFRRAFAM